MSRERLGPRQWARLEAELRKGPLAHGFARSLVEDGLAASAHNYTPVRSIYTWQGRVHERAEGRVSLHTSRGRVADIVARAKREHPYEVPGVSARPIIDGNPDYLAWIAKATGTSSAA